MKRNKAFFAFFFRPKLAGWTAALVLVCLPGGPLGGAQPDVPALGTHLDLARQALDLEKQGKHGEALALLRKLSDAAFIEPAHRELVGETEDGRMMAEWIPARAIGNRRLAMMRCHLALDHPKEAVDLAWETVEAGTADAAALACIAEHAKLQGGLDPVRARYEKLLANKPVEKPVDRAARLGLQYVEVQRELAEGDFPALVDRIRRVYAHGPEAKLQRHIADTLARNPQAIPLLTKALDPKAQPTWIVYCLGQSGDGRAVEPLFDYLLAVKNYYARKDTVRALSQLGNAAVSFAMARLKAESPAVREAAAEVLSRCPAEALNSADPGAAHLLGALRDPRNRGAEGHVNIPIFLLRAVAATGRHELAPKLKAVKQEAGSFGQFGDRQYRYTLAHLGDRSVVPALIDELDGDYSHFARPALKAATGKSFSTKAQWQAWWEQSGQGAGAATATKSPRLVDEQEVFPPEDDGWRVRNTYWPMMRLSPDGHSLLYLRRAKAEGDQFALTLRDLKTGKDRSVPIPPVERGMATFYTRLNPFAPDGKRLVLTRFGEGGRQSEVVLWNVGDKEAKATGIEGRFVFAKFDRTGKGLIVNQRRAMAVASCKDFQLKPLGVGGLLPSVCPAADVICLLGFLPGEAASRREGKLLLYDVAADKTLAELPLENPSQLDDLETQWTADGRYVYYGDPPAVRVWDRVGGKAVDRFDAQVPMGPGPTPTTMVLKRLPRRNQDTTGGPPRATIVLHEATSGETWDLGDASMELQDALAGTVVYLRHTPGGSVVVHTARIAMPTLTY